VFFFCYSFLGEGCTVFFFGSGMVRMRDGVRGGAGGRLCDLIFDCQIYSFDCQILFFVCGGRSFE
jgi:hypothetical protein